MQESCAADLEREKRLIRSGHPSESRVQTTPLIEEARGRSNGLKSMASSLSCAHPVDSKGLARGSFNLKRADPVLVLSSLFHILSTWRLSEKWVCRESSLHGYPPKSLFSFEAFSFPSTWGAFNVPFTCTWKSSLAWSGSFSGGKLSDFTAPLSFIWASSVSCERLMVPLAWIDCLGLACIESLTRWISIKLWWIRRVSAAKLAS